jgi:hypothetical protein
MTRPELVAPVPFASILYCEMVALETRIKASWRGLGSDEDTKALAEISTRLDALEDATGPGMAWTPVDEVLARCAVRGVAHVDREHLDWLSACYERADLPMPVGYRSRT